MKLLHFPWLRRLLNRGVNTDVLPELMPDGTAREAINVRPGSITGNAGGAEAVKGEVSVYAPPAGQGYVLIGSASCNNKLVEFWASEDFDFATSTNVPIVRIDGAVVAQSRNIPYVYNRPLQIAVTDDLFGTSIAENEPGNDGVVVGRGIVYPADHFSPPLYWNVSDLVNLSNSGDQSYFGDNYSTDINSVNLLTIPEFPVHTRNVDLGVGLPCGQYSYSLRWVTAQGDRTNLGPETPLITVPIKQHPIAPWQQDQYPGALTIGGLAEEPSPYGIELKFRVDNRYGFSRAEIVRRKFNDATNVAQLEVVGIIPIVDGQVSVETFVDPQDAIATPEIIPEEEVAQRLIAVEKPKSVEYSDRRLTYANFESQQRIFSDIEFIERNGVTVAPITQGVYTRIGQPGNWTRDWNDGYSDPVNNTYLKSFVRGEKYGLGVMFWDQYSSTSYVSEITGTPDTGYQFPNRLDPKTGDSLIFSDDPITGATVNTQNTAPFAIEPTFDAFTQGSSTKSYKYFSYPYGDQGYNSVNVQGGSNSAFNPWGPTNPLTVTTQGGSNDQTRMSVSPVALGVLDGTTSFILDAALSSSSAATLTGEIWGPRHHALGGIVHGINNIPDRVGAFSVMRTAPAGRVVAQGIACYIPRRDFSVVFPPTSVYAKTKNEARLIVPDFMNGTVDLSLIDTFESSPQSFKLQFVRPVGLYTEAYNIRDFLTYAGVQRDSAAVNNGLEAPAGQAMAYNNYVGYNAWRTLNPTPGPFDVANDGGNRVFDVQQVEPTTMEGYTSWRVVLSDDMYSVGETTAGEDNANDDSYRNFNEPWYIVNIILDTANVSNDTIDRYINTGYHVKTYSCIGVSDGTAIQQFPLVSERRGDVYADPGTAPAPPVSPTTGAYNRYIYIEQGGIQRPWLCVTDNAEANINQAAILAQLALGQPYQMQDGTLIYGVYEFIDNDAWSSSSRRDFTGIVQFGLWGPTTVVPVPADGSRIVVKYDKNEPIKFFGGDSTVTPSLGLLFNYQYKLNPDGDDPDEGTQNTLGSGAPLPYRGWLRNSGYNMMQEANDSWSQSATIRSGNFRQWAVYFDCERRSAPRYQTGGPGNLQGPFEWPRMGYIIRPLSYWLTVDFTSPQDGNSHVVGWYQYNPISVGGTQVQPRVDSAPMAAFGGFLWNGALNASYFQQSPVSGFGVPYDENGQFQERRYFPNGLITSLEFNQLSQDVPGLRTFLDSNLKTVSEENGEIKVIASALAGGGRNMYAWTDNGVVRVLTNKNVLTGADGAAVATQSILNYWGEEMWLSRNIGIPDQMWQFFVKGYAPTGDGYADNFFWADRNSLYRMVGDNIIDIGREKFLAYMLPILRSYPRGYVPGTSGFYNRKYNEAWMSLNLPTRVPGMMEKNLVVFNPEINAWNGRYTYQFDGYTQVGNDVYGHRNLETFRLDEEWNISGAPRVASITVPMTGDQNLPFDTFKEFMRWRVVGSVPDAIEILDPDFVVMSRMDAATNNSPLWVKEYDGWEGWASRTLASYGDGSRKLPQKRYFYLRLIWNTPTDKNATSLSGQLKAIK
jgi:hypothetical protein